MAKLIIQLALATVLATATAYAQQDADQSIVGCADVGCPASSQDSANDNCTVAGRSFPYVGVTHIPTTDDALSGLAWSKGFNITNSADEGRKFGSSFYLDTPADLDLSNTGACAIFFHGVSQFISFDKDAPTDETAQGTCGDAMGSSCVDALTERARNLDVSDAANPGEACDKLRKDLKDNQDVACQRIPVAFWSNFTSVALTGNGAPVPITSQQNASSNCWPAAEKQDDLTLVSDRQVPGSKLVDDMNKAQFAITPILTLFYPDGEGSLVNTTEASLSCIKVMGPSLASVDTMRNGSTDVDGAAPGLSTSAPYFLVSVALATTLISFVV